MTMTIASGREAAGPRLSHWLLLAFIATLLGAVTGIGYFTIGGAFGPVSDAASVVMGLTLMPVALGLRDMFQSAEPRFSRWTCGVGLVGFTLFAGGGLVLVLSAIGVEWLPNGVALGGQFFGVFLQGAWLSLIGILTLRTGVFDRAVGWAAVIAGGGYLLFGIGSPLGPTNPLPAVGGFIGLVAFLTWALRARLHVGNKAF